MSWSSSSGWTNYIYMILRKMFTRNPTIFASPDQPALISKHGILSCQSLTARSSAYLQLHLQSSLFHRCLRCSLRGIAGVPLDTRPLPSFLKRHKHCDQRTVTDSLGSTIMGSVPQRYQDFILL